VGSVPYKGFFDVAAAEAEAEALRARGQDVCVVAVPAYSTLGWLDDPITAPMLRRSDERVVETVLHELVHSTVFIPSEPEFNEGVARFIGQEASVRFFGTEAERARVTDDRRVAAELLAFREQVAALYAEALEPAATVERRRQMEAAFRERLGALALATRDTAALAAVARLNDACLALSGTYAADDSRHERVLAQQGEDLARFVALLREAAEADDPRAFFFAAGGGEP
jgi:predicted aminopeptidase